MVKLIERSITAADGFRLAARFFVPDGQPAGSVLLVPAMGVPQSFYEPFARWAAANGFVTASFDYRGMGRSRPASLRGFQADLFDWARLDCQAVLDALAWETSGHPLYWIGHSLGGQILPFVDGRERIRKMITIGTGSGYWRENSPPLKRRVWLLWYLVVPLTLPLFGYFPGQRLGMVGDLPKAAMTRWRRWCLNPDYAVGAEPGVREQYAAVRTPIVSLSFEDDEFMSARNTESLHGFYVNAPRRMLRIAPRDAGLERIGHFGFFRREHEDSLWRRYVLPELMEPAEAAARATG